MPIATKQAVKKIYTRSISCGNRKSCPTCKVKLLPDEKIWSSGEYESARWYTINRFCKQCYHEVFVETCQEFCDRKGAVVYVKMYCGETRPIWLHSVITSTVTVFNSDKV